MKKINVIGAGLSGSEAAFYLASKGYRVNLYEMRPVKESPAHHTSLFGELVCSNSLKNERLDNAAGLLKKEIQILGSLVMESAINNRVPGGNALCVDRHAFATYITEKISTHPNIRIIHEEITSLPEGINIIATGPLTSPSLVKELQKIVGESFLSFYDASAPIITKDSINFDKVYLKSRYNQDEGSYLNCPMNGDEYNLFYSELINAQKVILHDFEKDSFFEGCQPIEVMAKRGRNTLRFGPLKPQGLEHGLQKPFAVVQLRQDDFRDSLYTLVGFQTNLTYPEQKRIFSLIPGLENAEFIRYGLMHKNIYVCSPKILSSKLSLKDNEEIYLAGQLSGVEGYVESAMIGLVVAILLHLKLSGRAEILPPSTTICGALTRYIIYANPYHFSPMNAMFNLIPGYNKNDREKIGLEALRLIKNWKEDNNV